MTPVGVPYPLGNFRPLALAFHAARSQLAIGGVGLVRVCCPTPFLSHSCPIPSFPDSLHSHFCGRAPHFPPLQLFRYRPRYSSTSSNHLTAYLLEELRSVEIPGNKSDCPLSLTSSRSFPSPSISRRPSALLVATACLGELFFNISRAHQGPTPSLRPMCAPFLVSCYSMLRTLCKVRRRASGSLISVGPSPPPHHRSAPSRIRSHSTPRNARRRMLPASMLRARCQSASIFRSHLCLCFPSPRHVPPPALPLLPLLPGG